MLDRLGHCAPHPYPKIIERTEKQMFENLLESNENSEEERKVILIDHTKVLHFEILKL